MPSINTIIVSSDAASTLSMINAARTKWGLGTVSKTFTGVIKASDIQYLKDRVIEANDESGAEADVNSLTSFVVGQPIRVSILELLKSLSTEITNYCTCNARCSCNCNYACTCNCDYACTCDARCSCNGRCSCNCDYACTCDARCSCDCHNVCTCDCNYACTCDSRCACDARCYCDCHNNDGVPTCEGFADEW